MRFNVNFLYQKYSASKVLFFKTRKEIQKRYKSKYEVLIEFSLVMMKLYVNLPALSTEWKRRKNGSLAYYFKNEVEG